MRNQSQKYHHQLAEYFHSKDYFIESIEEQKQHSWQSTLMLRKVNLRKVNELPWQRLKTNNWDKIEKLFLDIFFLEAKTEAGKVIELLNNDFKNVINFLPNNRQLYRVMCLLNEALSRDLHFIANHPTLIFQCLWNRCWWYDNPNAANFYELISNSELIAPWNLPGIKLYTFLEMWYKEKKQKNIDFTWLRALRPLDVLSDRSNYKVLRNHVGAVTAVSVSPNGTFIVSGGCDGYIRLWSVESCIEIKKQHRNSRLISMVKYSPDGKYICSSSLDGSMNFWTVDNLDEITTIQIEDEIWSIAFLPDSKRIACGTNKGEIIIYNFQTGIKEISFREAYFQHQNHVNTLAISPDGQKFLAGIGSKNLIEIDGSLSGVWLWDLKSSECKGIRIHKNNNDDICYCVAEISPDGKCYTIGNQYVNFGFFGKETSQHSISTNFDWIRAIAYSPDGKLMAFSGDDPIIHVWDLQTNNEKFKLEGHTEGVESLCFFPDSKRLVSCSEDVTIRIWDIDSPMPNIYLKNLFNESTIDNSPKNIFSFSPKDTIGAYIKENTIIITDASFSTIQCTLEHNSVVKCFCWTTDGKQIVSVTDGGEIHFWVLWSELPVKIIKSSQRIRCIASSNEGNWTITGNMDGKVFRWNSKGESQELILHNNPPPWSVSQVTISQYGNCAAAATGDSVINVWDVVSGNLICRHIPEKVKKFGFLVWGEDPIIEIAFSEKHNFLYILQSHQRGGFSQMEWNLKVKESNPKVLSSINGDVKALANSPEMFRWLALGRNPDTVIIDTKDDNSRVAFFPTQLKYLTAAPYEGLWANLKGNNFSIFHLERLRFPMLSNSNLNCKNKNIDSLKTENIENMKKDKFKISFCLLLENESVFKYQETINSLEHFIKSSTIISQEESEIICISSFKEVETNIISNKLRVINEQNWPKSKFDNFYPLIINQFHIAKHNIFDSHILIIVTPSQVIRNVKSLESAIISAAEDSNLLVVLKNLKDNSFPDSLIINMKFKITGIPITLGASSRWGVKVKKKFFGGFSFQFQGFVEQTDISWLMAAIAAEYERDRDGRGLKVMTLNWMWS